VRRNTVKAGDYLSKIGTFLGLDWH
jgi:hypothetical protein